MTYKLTRRMNSMDMLTINIRTDFTLADITGMYLAKNNSWDSFNASQALMDERIQLVMVGITKKKVINSVKDYVESYGVYSYWDEKVTRVESVYEYALDRITDLFK